MDNISANASISAADNVAAIIGTATAEGVLLLVVLIAMALNLILIAALIGKDNSELVLSIRVILINILIACVVGALNSTMYHIASPILRVVGSLASRHGPPLCRANLFLSNISSSGRVLFTAFYGIAVFIVIHFWNRPVLAPRNTKYFIIASAVVWLLAVAAGIPALLDESFGGFCSMSNNVTQDSQNTNFHYSLLVALPYLTVSCIPIIITPVIMIETSCYIKRKSIREHRDTKRALVKFGLFLLIIQAFNSFTQIGIPLLALGISRLKTERSIVLVIAVVLSDLFRIPTNALILIFFKPVRVRVKRWICCCCHGRKRATKSRTETNGTTANA